MVMNFAFPFGFDHNGRTATDDSTAHVRSMIEQILFTNPGERVNRPDFGSGLLGLVHSPNSEVMAAALQASVHGALQRWLGDVLDVQRLEVSAVDNKLLVNVVYALRRTGELMNESFERSVA
jgi:phage baseplate assembly protein W